MKTEKNLKIRDFKTSDLPSIRRIIDANFENPWSDSMILSENSFTYKTVAVIEKQIVGFLSGEIMYDESNILMIAVDKSFQRRGIGRALVSNFLEKVRSCKISSVYLEVSKNNDIALNFYRKLNFKEYGMRKSYYSNGEDAVLMKLDL